MDTSEKYLGADIFVETVDGRQYNVPDEAEIESVANERAVGLHPSVDGWVTFYDESLLQAGEAFKFGSFPFRDHRHDDEPWFAFPNGEKGHKYPVWKWVNPTHDIADISLKPSIGMGVNSPGPTMHCYVKNGKIDWL